MTPEQRAAAGAIIEQEDALLNSFPTKPCGRCAGRGYHHGFGEDGHDPDWCDQCGGAGYISDEDAYNEKRASIVAEALRSARLAGWREGRDAAAQIAHEAAQVDACSPTDRITRASRAGSIEAAILALEPDGAVT